MPLSFRVEARSGAARAGMLTTPHGTIATPAFMPVATQASVKTLTPDEARDLGADIVLCNTYHLYLRPGVEVVERLGGLHRFMGWHGPILTDSGGYQAFSLGTLRRVTDDGVRFRSHVDGSEHTFTPESAVEHQARLGADIAMCLDHCVAHGEKAEAVGDALVRTHRWAARCRQTPRLSGQALFGIAQGGTDRAMREESARYLASLGFDGYAIGGLAVGESKALMYETTAFTAERLPAEQPRYLMGVGAPDDLVECVARGVDMFDCALPTRVARNGGLFTPKGRVDITAARFREMDAPLDDGCDCYACRHFSAAYLNHLYRAGELLALRLGTLHNLRFVLRLMADMRQAIADGTFEAFRAAFLAQYVPTDEATRVANKARWMDARGVRGQTKGEPRRRG
ncbi:MAG: tRNA guanosine(34) transglycosylase Tgt [Chloroflexota bacterium]|nr:tRNA guanosine(34) transglycosylase Tgt [Chloroflexota bacterium]